MTTSLGILLIKGFIIEYLLHGITVGLVLILLLMLYLGGKLNRNPVRDKTYVWKILTISVVVIVSAVMALFSGLDVYNTAIEKRKMTGYLTAYSSLISVRSAIEQYHATHKQYPVTADDMSKIEYAAVPQVHIGYQFDQGSGYTITAFHEKWKDLEFRLWNGSEDIFVRNSREPNSGYREVENVEKMLQEKSASSNFLSFTWHRVTGRSRKYNVDVTVNDSDTSQPIWGAHVVLGYHRKMKKSVQGWINKSRECSGQAEGVTDKVGKINLAFTVDNCPTTGIEDETLHLTVKSPDYATYEVRILPQPKRVALEKLGYSAVMPPLKIEYPRHVIDIPKYWKNFEVLNEANSREIGEPGEKSAIHNYFAWEYSRQQSFNDRGFDPFFEKISDISNIEALPLLQEVLDKKFQLPYKSYKMSDDPSWRVSEYLYEEGRAHVAKALLNISDTRADGLLLSSTDIPSAYVHALVKRNIQMTEDDYWNYLSGRYMSRAHSPMVGGNPLPDPLLLIKIKMQHRLPRSEYAKALLDLYRIAASNAGKKEQQAYYNWEVDQRRLAKDLFGFNLPGFIAEVKEVLPQMDSNSEARRYMMYLYKQREYSSLISILKANHNVMKAFLAEDVKGSTSWNTTTNETNDLFAQENLLPKMPKVTELIKEQIETYLKQKSTDYTYYRWWITNLSVVNRQSAEKIFQDIYQKASVEPYKENSKYEKQYVLRGAAEVRLTGMCQTIYEDLLIRDKMKRDFFSVAQDRLLYLSSACPTQFKKLVSSFNVVGLKVQMKKKGFESNYGYDAKDFRDSIWQGVEKYFPQKQAIIMLSQYICDNDEVIRGAYSGSNMLPVRYPIKCLCERIKRDSEGSDSAGGVRFEKYLDTCYPTQTKEIRKAPRTASREPVERDYQAFIFLVKGQRGYSSGKFLYDDKFESFFKGTPAAPEISVRKDDAGYWLSRLESNKALPILEKAVTSQDIDMVRAGLYGLSFYPSTLSQGLVSKLQQIMSLGKYPEDLYAAYSLAVSGIQTSCTKATDYHLNIIENRDLSRLERTFAFNAVLSLDLCSRTGEEQPYRRLLNALLDRHSTGRYAMYQADLERIVASNNININQLIQKMTESKDVIDILLGIRLSELKKYPLAVDFLSEQLNHNDSYVRTAAGKYISINKNRYVSLYKSLSLNTNRRVRALRTLN